MLGLSAPPVVEKVVAPLIARLARAGVPPDVITVVGTVGAVAGAVLLFGTGHLFWGTVVVTLSVRLDLLDPALALARGGGTVVVSLSVLLDLLDGALARARGGGTVFGAVLDSVGDRDADSIIFGALIWWYSGMGDDRLLVLLALLCLVLGVLTSYIKARAEGVGIAC